MQLAHGSLGILRDSMNQLDVLEVRELLTSADNWIGLLLFSYPIPTNVYKKLLYLLIT
jgi:hypothetical protein